MEIQSVLGPYQEPFFYGIFFKVLASVIAVTIIIICVYLKRFLF